MQAGIALMLPLPSLLSTVHFSFVGSILTKSEEAEVNARDSLDVEER